MDLSSAMITASATVFAAIIAVIASRINWRSSIIKDIEISRQLRQEAKTDEEIHLADLMHKQIFSKVDKKINRKRTFGGWFYLLIFIISMTEWWFICLEHSIPFSLPTLLFELATSFFVTLVVIIFDLAISRDS